MARLAVVRDFLTIAHKQKLYFACNNYYSSGRLMRNLKCSAGFSSSTTGNERTEEERSREERSRREKRYVGLIIGSSVGLIGCLYFLFRRLTNAHAQSKAAPAIDSNSENSVDKNQQEGNEETDAKTKKDKQGFRERRVRNYFLKD